MVYTRSLWHQHALAPLPPEMLGYDVGTLSACAALGALLPDLDASQSKIKHLTLLGTNLKPFLPIAHVIQSTSEHRGLLHSAAGLALVAGVVTPAVVWLGWAPAVALLLGYSSHLCADAATKSGIRLLYPRQQHYHLLPRRWRFTTGSQAEEVCFAVLAACVLWLLWQVGVSSLKSQCIVSPMNPAIICRWRTIE